MEESREAVFLAQVGMLVHPVTVVVVSGIGLPKKRRINQVAIRKNGLALLVAKTKAVTAVLAIVLAAVALAVVPVVAPVVVLVAAPVVVLVVAPVVAPVAALAITVRLKNRK